MWDGNTTVISKVNKLSTIFATVLYTQDLMYTIDVKKVTAGHILFSIHL